MTIKFGIEARNSLCRGAELLARVVGVTYGPKGQTVLLDRVAGILATKDGVTVAREVDLEDPFENMGAQILKQACITVNDNVGDGTTSTAILASEILREAHKAVIGGLDPMQLYLGVQNAAQEAVSYLEDIAISVQTKDQLVHVAMISSNGDSEIAEHLSEAVMAVGRDGTILIEDGKSSSTTLVFKDGMELLAATNEAFLNGGSATYGNPLVAVIAAPLRTVEDVQDILECASQWPNQPLIVFAESIEGQALSTMTLNNTEGVVICCGINAPGMAFRKKEYLEDIAALCHATCVTKDLGLDHKSWDINWFGTAQQISVTERKTTILADEEYLSSSEVEDRVASLKRELDYAKSAHDTDRLRERISKLTGGVAVLSVGGHSEAEMKERRARIEDALSALRAALEGGVVPGAGVAYYVLSKLLTSDPESDFGYGRSILRKALLTPMLVLAANAKANPFEVQWRADQAFENGEIWIGFDPIENTYRKFNEGSWIIDPSLVVQHVISAAASVSGTLLTVEAGIVK
jgi:chaperonin GroEL